MTWHPIIHYLQCDLVHQDGSIVVCWLLPGNIERCSISLQLSQHGCVRRTWRRRETETAKLHNTMPTHSWDGNKNWKEKRKELHTGREESMAHQHVNSVLCCLMQYRIHVYVSQALFPIVRTYACWTFYTIPILHSASHIDRWLGTNLDSVGAYVPWTEMLSL